MLEEAKLSSIHWVRRREINCIRNHSPQIGSRVTHDAGVDGKFAASARVVPDAAATEESLTKFGILARCSPAKILEHAVLHAFLFSEQRGNSRSKGRKSGRPLGRFGDITSGSV